MHSGFSICVESKSRAWAQNHIVEIFHSVNDWTQCSKPAHSLTRCSAVEIQKNYRIIGLSRLPNSLTCTTVWLHFIKTDREISDALRTKIGLRFFGLHFFHSLNVEHRIFPRNRKRKSKRIFASKRIAHKQARIHWITDVDLRIEI